MLRFWRHILSQNAIDNPTQSYLTIRNTLSRFKKKSVLNRLIFSTILLLLLGLPSQGRCDILLVKYQSVGTGHPTLLTQNASMPFVEVNISIIISGEWHYNISINCRFQIVCGNITQLNSAFVYPSTWFNFADLADGNLTCRFFDIRFNDTELEYEILSFEEFSKDYEANVTEEPYLAVCNFATFSAKVIPNATYWLEVSSEFEANSTVHQFTFSYIVGTARSWIGDAHEIVRMNVSTRTQIESSYFYPESCLSIEMTNESKTAVWDFHADTFEHNYVNLLVTQKKPTDSDDTGKRLWYLINFLIFPVTIVGLAIIFMICLIKSYYPTRVQFMKGRFRNLLVTRLTMLTLWKSVVRN